MAEKGNFLREQAAPAREQPFFRGSIGTLFTRAEPDLLEGPTTPRRTAGRCFQDVVACSLSPGGLLYLLYRAVPLYLLYLLYLLYPVHGTANLGVYAVPLLYLLYRCCTAVPAVPHRKQAHISHLEVHHTSHTPPPCLGRCTTMVVSIISWMVMI